MAESFEDTLRNGYGTWKDNLNIGVPYLLSLIVAAFIIAGSVAFYIFILHQGNYEKAVDNMYTASNIIYLLIILLISLLSVSFFTAGAMGMAKKAIETGKCSLDDMMYYGTKKAASIMTMYIILALVAIVSLVVFIPAAFSFLNASNIGVTLTLAGAAIYTLILLVLVFLSKPVIPAIIAGDTGPVTGIREGFRFTLKNKLSILLILSIEAVFNRIFNLVFETLTGPLQWASLVSEELGSALSIVLVIISMLLISVTLTPLYAVWLMRIYLSKTGGKVSQNAKPSNKPVKQPSVRVIRERPSELPEVYV